MNFVATAVMTPTEPLTGSWILTSGGGNAADSFLSLSGAYMALAVVVAFVLGAWLFARGLGYRL